MKKKRSRVLQEFMDVYDKSVYNVKIYIQWPEINFRDEHPISYAFFQELEDKYEMTKVEVQAKEVISKDDIQEFLVKPSKEFSHYITFVHKFVTDMEKLKEFNITLDVEKEQIFNSREKSILTHHKAWRKYFQNKEG